LALALGEYFIVLKLILTYVRHVQLTRGHSRKNGDGALEKAPWYIALSKWFMPLGIKAEASERVRDAIAHIAQLLTKRIEMESAAYRTAIYTAGRSLIVAIDINDTFENLHARTSQLEGNQGAIASLQRTMISSIFNLDRAFNSLSSTYDTLLGIQGSTTAKLVEDVEGVKDGVHAALSTANSAVELGQQNAKGLGEQGAQLAEVGAGQAALRADVGALQDKVKELQRQVGGTQRGARMTTNDVAANAGDIMRLQGEHADLQQALRDLQQQVGGAQADATEALDGVSELGEAADVSDQGVQLEAVAARLGNLEQLNKEQEAKQSKEEQDRISSFACSMVGCAIAAAVSRTVAEAARKQIEAVEQTGQSNGNAIEGLQNTARAGMVFVQQTRVRAPPALPLPPNRAPTLCPSPRTPAPSTNGACPLNYPTSVPLARACKVAIVALRPPPQWCPRARSTG
jgi:chromosome segregation ATPase